MIAGRCSWIMLTDYTRKDLGNFAGFALQLCPKQAFARVIRGWASNEPHGLAWNSCPRCTLRCDLYFSVLISLSRCRMIFPVAPIDLSIQQCLKGTEVAKAPLPSGLPGPPWAGPWSWPWSSLTAAVRGCLSPMRLWGGADIEKDLNYIPSSNK